MGKKETVQLQEVRISDLSVAAYSLSLDYALTRLDDSAGRVAFIFSGVPEEVLLEFYGGEALVNARKLLGAFRDLKGLLFEYERRRR